MRILVDPQIFSIQTYGGISRYYNEIFKEISKFENVNVDLPIVFTNNEYLNNSDLIHTKLIRKRKSLEFLNKIGISTRKKIKKINEKVLNKSFDSKNYDLFIPTYYGSYFLEKNGNKPFVLTVYDMIHELFPQYFENDSFEVVKNKKLLLEKASGIIAVSENTKKDILKIFPHINQDKIRVIYHGNSIQINQDVNIDLPEKYILFVGSRDNYKNFRFLTESIQNLLIENHDLFLVCAGGGNFNDFEKEFLNKLGLTNKVIQISFKEEQLGTIYNKAICFVFPSEYEGFGIPVLESMACKCPIVLTNNSSFPEVAGNAGIFFELNNKKDLIEKIELVIHDNDFRAKHIKLGEERIKSFDWKIKAQECYNFYKETISKKNA